MEFAICFRMVVFPALGGETINPRLAAPDGRDEIDQACRQRIMINFQVEAFIGKDRGEILKDRAGGWPLPGQCH